VKQKQLQEHDYQQEQRKPSQQEEHEEAENYLSATHKPCTIKILN